MKKREKKIMNELKNLILTYNAIMAGQSAEDENVISEKILKLADELGIDHEDLSDLTTEMFADNYFTPNDVHKSDLLSTLNRAAS